MTGDELQRFLDRNGLSGRDLSDLLNQALDRHYGPEHVSRWRRGVRPVPKAVGAFVEDLSISMALVPGAGPGASSPADGTGGDARDVSSSGVGPAPDTPPGGGFNVDPQPVVGASGGLYAKACEELWEVVAAGLGMVGAAIGSRALMADGAVIAADKEALGAAWGKLAETNEQFRKMLVGMTAGGAWIQVGVVTGTTVAKCWQLNHAPRLLEAGGNNGHEADVELADFAA
jgi:hypothetical protein